MSSEAAGWTLSGDFRAEYGWQMMLLRDLFGNPFRPTKLAPTWRTAAVVRLAEAAYNERDLPSGHLDGSRLAVLADTLEEAGCTDQQVLEHLRGPGPHYRGCFVLDLVLRWQ